MQGKTSGRDTNPFTKAFQQFNEDTFFENLHNKVKDKSYFEKYKGFKDTVLILSYLFNLASMLTASYAIFWLTKWLTGFIIVAYIVAGVFLFFLENLKRKSSNEFFRVWFFRKEAAAGWLVLSLCCLGISLFSSAFGTKTGTEELSPSAALIAVDSTATAYRNEVAKLENENEKLSSQTNHEGTIYYKLQSVIQKNTAMIVDYNTRILTLDKKLEGKNELLSTSYQQQVNITAWTLVWITILLELFFEACIAYIWYYYYRSYVERNNSDGTSNEKDLPSPLQSQIAEISKQLRQLQNAVKSANSIPIELDHPFDKKTQSNGISESNNTNPASSKRPIGFFSERQLAKMESTPTDNKKLSVQACTDLYRENLTDRYTVEHTYTKGNEKITTRYTLTQVEARIGQYQRELQEALNKKMDNNIIKNRQRWVLYWENKKQELLKKLELAA